MKWTYNGSEDFEVPIDAVGFVYKIVKRVSTIYDIPGNEHLNKPSEWTTLEDKIYIGKKLLTSTTKRKVGKRALEKLHKETGDRRKGQRIVRVTKESPWRSYNGSNPELQKEIEANPELFRKEILEFAYSKKNLSFLEAKYQFRHLDDIVNGRSYNGHVANWYIRDIVKPKTEEK